MNNPLYPEGCIDIDIVLGDGVQEPHRVQIQSSRPRNPGRIFNGRRVEELLSLLPALFSVCSKAQACAAVRAVEKAQGITPHPRIEKIREVLVYMETICEHLWRILMDWPVSLASAPDRKTMAAAKNNARTYEKILSSERNYFAPGIQPPAKPLSQEKRAELADTVAELVVLIESKILGCSLQTWLEIFGLQEFHQWVYTRDTCATQFIRYIIDNQWQSSGHYEAPTLEETGAASDEHLHRQMEDEDFVALPHWQGQCCETSSSARVSSPLLLALRKRHGNGLLVRVVSRLTELVMLTQQLVPVRIPGELTMGEVPQHTVAIGRVTAARGQLLHRVELEGSYVKRYQILAPTEWNFHPAGVVANALSTLKGTRDEVLQQARLLIEVIDPCVAYKVQAREAEKTNA